MSVLRVVRKLGFSMISNIVIPKRYYARAKEITIFLIESNGSKHRVLGEVDNKCTIHTAVHETIDMRTFGVCGGLPSCSTCHVIFNPEDYKKISTSRDEKELRVLKNTPEAGPTSRLGCQVLLEEFMDGIEIRLPSKTEDYRSKQIDETDE